MPPRIAPLQPEDRAAWEVLARGYKAFYKTPTADADYTTAWNRLLAQDGIHGLAVFVDGELVGIAHYLFGAARYYWLTQEDNEVARALYDKVAKHNGFIRYEYALQAKA